MTFRSSFDCLMRGGGCVSEEKSLLGSTYLVSLVCMLYVQAHFVGWRMTTDLLLNDATFFGVKEVSGKRPGRARWPLFGLLSQTHLVFIFPICPLSQVGIDSDRQREMWWIMDATQPTGQRSRFFLNLSLSRLSLSSSQDVLDASGNIKRHALDRVPLQAGSHPRPLLRIIFSVHPEK